MRKLVGIWIAVAGLTMGSATVLLADSEVRSKAYVTGEYVTALRESKVLAEQGDLIAQFDLPSSVQSAFDAVPARIASVISASDGYSDPAQRNRMSEAAHTVVSSMMLVWGISPEGQTALNNPNPMMARKAINDMARELQIEILDNPQMLKALGQGIEEIGSVSKNQGIFKRTNPLLPK